MKAREYQMDNNQFPNQSAPGAIGGSLLSVLIHLIQTNWSVFATQAAIEILKVVVIGILGGAAGIFGQYLMKKVLKSFKQ